jgi:dTDP-4-dehydrorhamnose reductase
MSTDYVFDGNSSSSLTEQAPANPVNWYGLTKLEGERLILQYNRNSLVIRTSWVFSAFGHNFVKTMMRLMKDGPTVRVVEDQIGSPTYAGDLAEALLQILEAENFVPGIFHVKVRRAVSIRCSNQNYQAAPARSYPFQPRNFQQQPKDPLIP